MSNKRPAVAAALMAELTESTPDRVRRRLDRKPDAANEWTREAESDRVIVQAGNETVSLPRETVHRLDEIACTSIPPVEQHPAARPETPSSYSVDTLVWRSRFGTNVSESITHLLGLAIVCPSA